MKKVYFLILFLACTQIIFPQVGTFAFETATIDGSNVVETIGTVTLTASFQGGANPGLNGYEGYGGITGNSLYNNLSSTTLTLSFNKPVEINSIRMADGGGSSGNFVLTPTPSGASVIANVPSNDGTEVNLGSSFDNITAITITKQSGGSTYFIIDDIVLQTVLPVELTTFTAAPKNNTIILNWATATEKNNYGFQIERKLKQNNSEWSNVGFVNGSGTSQSKKSYSFTDEKVTPGKYLYRLKQTDNDGKFEYSKIVEVTLTAPSGFSLGQNFPNPFNPSTTISFSLPEASNVQLTVYNMIGQVVSELVNGRVEAGVHETNFTAADLPSGLYIYSLKAVSLEGKESFKTTKKMTLLK